MLVKPILKSYDLAPRSSPSVTFLLRLDNLHVIPSLDARNRFIAVYVGEVSSQKLILNSNMFRTNSLLLY